MHNERDKEVCKSLSDIFSSSVARRLGDCFDQPLIFHSMLSVEHFEISVEVMTKKKEKMFDRFS